MRFYNTLTKEKEEFVPLNPGKVGMYTCGPTVYDFAHIGNLRAFVFSDSVRRLLEHDGYEVRLIENITDVGHLTEDDLAQGDSGEDKIARKAESEKKTPEEIARFYEDAFHADEKAMNILPAAFFPRATAHIPHMIAMIRVPIEKGHAYEVNGNVFYDVTSFPRYGKLSGNTLDRLKTGARLEEHPDNTHRAAAIAEIPTAARWSAWAITCPPSCNAVSDRTTARPFFSVKISQGGSGGQRPPACGSHAQRRQSARHQDQRRRLPV